MYDKGKYNVAGRISLSGLEGIPKGPTQLIGWNCYQVKHEEYPPDNGENNASAGLGPLPHLSELVRHPLRMPTRHLPPGETRPISWCWWSEFSTLAAPFRFAREPSRDAPGGVKSIVRIGTQASRPPLFTCALIQMWSQ